MALPRRARVRSSTSSCGLVDESARREAPRAGRRGGRRLAGREGRERRAGARGERRGDPRLRRPARAAGDARAFLRPRDPGPRGQPLSPAGRSRGRASDDRRRGVARGPRRRPRRAARRLPGRRADRPRALDAARLPAGRVGCSARSSEAPRRGDLHRDDGRPAASPPGPRRDLPARRDAERDARPAGSGLARSAGSWPTRATSSGRFWRSSEPSSSSRSAGPRSPEELLAALDSAAEEVERLSRLAEDLLVLARADEGPSQPPRSGSIKDLLETVAGRFSADRGGPATARRSSATTCGSSRHSGTSSTTPRARRGHGSRGGGAAQRLARVAGSDEERLSLDLLPVAFERFTRGDEAGRRRRPRPGDRRRSREGPRRAGLRLGLDGDDRAYRVSDVPIAIRGCFAGSSQRSTVTSLSAGRLTQPFVDAGLRVEEDP